MTPTCPVCSKESVLVNGREIYPHRPDLYSLKFYRCENHTEYYVGCHKGTTNALGVLANKEHRNLKMKCHKIFDPLWKSKKHSRNGLYKKLSQEMNISIDKTHFGMFSADQLKTAYRIMKEW